MNYVQPLAARDIYLAQRTNQINMDGPEGQQKIENFKIMPQLKVYRV